MHHRLSLLRVELPRQVSQNLSTSLLNARNLTYRGEQELERSRQREGENHTPGADNSEQKARLDAPVADSGVRVTCIISLPVKVRPRGTSNLRAGQIGMFRQLPGWTCTCRKRIFTQVW